VLFADPDVDPFLSSSINSVEGAFFGIYLADRALARHSPFSCESNVSNVLVTAVENRLVDAVNLIFVHGFTLTEGCFRPTRHFFEAIRRASAYLCREDGDSLTNYGIYSNQSVTQT
jgi:hypothetical protein